jgi:hypothetical protein
VLRLRGYRLTATTKEILGMTSITLETLLTDSASAMTTAANVLEEHASRLAGDDDEREDRLNTLNGIIFRLNRNAARLEGVLIGMRSMNE